MSGFKRLINVFFCSDACRMLLLFSVLLFVLVIDRLSLIEDVLAVNFNCWLGFVYKSMPLALIGMIPLWLFGKSSRWVYFCLFFVLLVLVPTLLFARINFDMTLDGGIIGIIAGSSKDEFLSFIGVYGFGILLLLLCYVLTLVIVYKFLAYSCKSRATHVTGFYSVFSIICFVYASNALVTKFRNAFTRQPSLNLIVDSFRKFCVYDRLADMKFKPELQNFSQIRDAITNELVAVFVLGESATRNHCQIYGYARPTTPNMMARRDEIVLFENLTSLESTTCECMRYLLTTRTLERPLDFRYTLPQALGSAGYDVALLLIKSAGGSGIVMNRLILQDAIR